MKAIGIPEAFLKMVKMLFHGAEASVYTSNGESSPFPVLSGIRQGCPLTSYLFLFIGEILNIAVKKAVAEDTLLGIILPKGVDKLLIIQYEEDTNLMIAATESNFRVVSQLLHKFGLASGLSIN